jgi:WD40 repeat protein
MPIEKVAFNPVKDAELCSVSGDGVVKFWDVRTKVCINEVKGLGDTFTLVWHPDGQSLIVGTKVGSIITPQLRAFKFCSRIPACPSHCPANTSTDRCTSHNRSNPICSYCYTPARHPDKSDRILVGWEISFPHNR